MLQPVLNPASPVPLYQQLAELLRERIVAGEYAEGARIPSEPELAAAFSIGRPTVRQATEALVRSGLVERRRGAGTFVLGRPPEVDLFSLGGTVRAFREQGLKLETRWLRPLSRRPVAASRDHAFAGRVALCAVRLGCLGAKPVLLEEMFLEPEVFRRLGQRALEHRSLSEVVRQEYFLEPVAARQVFSIVRLRGWRARSLDRRAGEPALLVRRTLDFPRAKGLIYAELICLTDRVGFAQTIGGTHDA